MGFVEYITVSEATAPAPEPTSLPADTQCDASLWNHVYHSRRLIVKQQCIAVTGTIVDATTGKKADGVRHDGDGDTHGWLKLDSQYENLLNAGNISDEPNCLAGNSSVLAGIC